MHTVASRLTRDSGMPLLECSTGSESEKVLRAGNPGIVAVSFTNTAVNNINRALDGIIPCFTIHKILGFRPVAYEIITESGESKTTRKFEPLYNAMNPLPKNLRTIIIEESGVVSITLFAQLLAAIPDVSKVQFIFLGDLFQLDPPYDPAILGFVLTSAKFRKIELTQVYRQKLNSPILQFVLDIKDKIMVPSNKMESRCISNEHGTLLIKPWKHRLDDFRATLEAAKFLRKQWEAGEYFPEKDQVILPFNKRFGSTELNILISDWLGKARKAVVHEIIAGFDKRYLAVGDHVMVAKQRGIITNIARNDSYLGKQSPQLPSTNLDRFGFNNGGKVTLAEAELLEQDSATHDEIDRLMAATLADNEDRLRAASHVVTVKLNDSGYEVELSSGGDFGLNKFDFSYCMTCYKAQGSEWDNVYVFTHKSHAVSLCNEFFYTAASRAKKKLVMVVEPDHLSRVMVNQSIKGDNWQEKAKHFARNISKLSALPLVAKFILNNTEE
jgi:ATP-dependent exoDNAse (exonuclease V) alpha subunit